MAEKPILFSTEMVKALLAGRKTQTRRLVKPAIQDCTGAHLAYKEADWCNEPPEFIDSQNAGWYCRYCGNGTNAIGDGFKCPYGKVGDVLWVRETWNKYSNVGDCGLGCEYGCSHGKYVYAATGVWDDEVRWKPSIHMPRAAARIFLEITDIRVERLQDISTADIEREGISFDKIKGADPCVPASEHLFQEWKNLWQSINGEQSWNDNPFVWVISFKVLSTTGNPQTEK